MTEPTAEELLWNEGVSADAVVVDQYKLYVEMADRISARRGLANTFFLTLNSAIFTLFGVLWKDKPPRLSDAVVVLLAVAAVGQCAVWLLLVRSYRLLNKAKWDVVGLLEKRLPAAPYTAEWEALGGGRSWTRYIPLSYAESWVPYLFAAIYLVAAAILLAS